MRPIWDKIIGDLNSFPDGTHEFLSACPETPIADVEAEFGEMPVFLVEMVRHFNGAELFCCPHIMITLFGISPRRPVSRFKWAPDWYIDKFTRAWRNANPESDLWAFAMSNYGGLMLASNGGRIREWDTSINDWGESFRSMKQWMEYIIDEGRVYMFEG